MQSEKHLHSYSWRINVQVKASSFNFRLRATSFGSNWTLHRFSLILKLRKFFSFTLISDRPKPIAQQSRLGFFRARLIDVIQKFRARITKKNRSISGKRGSISKKPKVLIRIGFLVVWFLGFVAQLMWKKDPKRVMIIASVGFVVSLLRKKSRKFVNMRGLWIAATVACVLLCEFDSYMEAWNKTGGLYSLVTSS